MPRKLLGSVCCSSLVRTEAIADANKKLKWANGLAPNLENLRGPNYCLSFNRSLSRTGKYKASIEQDLVNAKTELEAPKVQKARWSHFFGRRHAPPCSVPLMAARLGAWFDSLALSSDVR